MMEKRPSPSARSSMDRAIGFYPVGWGFESLRARLGAIIEDRAEHQPRFRYGAICVAVKVMLSSLSG